MWSSIDFLDTWTGLSLMKMSCAPILLMTPVSNRIVSTVHGVGTCSHAHDVTSALLLCFVSQAPARAREQRNRRNDRMHWDNGSRPGTEGQIQIERTMGGGSGSEVIDKLSGLDTSMGGKAAMQESSRRKRYMVKSLNLLKACTPGLVGRYGRKFGRDGARKFELLSCPAVNRAQGQTRP